MSWYGHTLSIAGPLCGEYTVYQRDILPKVQECGVLFYNLPITEQPVEQTVELSMF